MKNKDAHDLNNNEIDLLEIFNIVNKGRIAIISITLLASVLGVIYSLMLPNIYESRALLVSSSHTKQTGIPQNYGALANLAGIDISAETDGNNEDQALEKITSLSFFQSNIMPNINLADLMAFKKWNSYNNSVEYNSELFDYDSGLWNTDTISKLPSAQESYRVFKSKHLNVTKDQKTNFVKITIKHQSPYIAKEWAHLLIEEINGFYRKKDKDKAEKALSYLTNQISQTNLSEIKQVIALLMQKETQKLTLIEANEFYVFEYIDPPAIMEQKSEPSRSSIVILAALLGILMGVVVVLGKHYLFKR